MGIAEFNEKQKFNQWWLWLIIISTALLLLGLAVGGAYQQLIKGIPFGDKPMPDTALVVFLLFCVSFSVGMIWLFLKAELETKIDRRGVHYRFYPYIRQWRFIPKDEIREWTVKRYFSTGYGIRRTGKFSTLNVRGNIGLELVLYNGKHIRLGTQDATALQKAMHTFLLKEDED